MHSEKVGSISSCKTCHTACMSKLIASPGSSRRVLSARLCTPSTRLHRSAVGSELHPAPPAAARSGRSTSGAWPCRGPRSFRSPRRLALRIEAVLTPRGSPLLWPLLTCPLALRHPASHPIPVRRPQVSLPASFSESLSFLALQFTPVVAINFREDFHLQVDGHAGHTSDEGRADIDAPFIASV